MAVTGAELPGRGNGDEVPGALTRLLPGGYETLRSARPHRKRGPGAPLRGAWAGSAGASGAGTGRAKGGRRREGGRRGERGFPGRAGGGGEKRSPGKGFPGRVKGGGKLTEAGAGEWGGRSPTSPRR